MSGGVGPAEEAAARGAATAEAAQEAHGVVEPLVATEAMTVPAEEERAAKERAAPPSEKEVVPDEEEPVKAGRATKHVLTQKRKRSRARNDENVDSNRGKVEQRGKRRQGQARGSSQAAVVPDTLPAGHEAVAVRRSRRQRR